MQSKNPVFSRSQSAGWGSQATPTPQQLQNMYDSPSYVPPAQPAYRTMTIDDVVVRGFMTLGTLVVAAAASWYLQVPMGVAIGSAIVALVLGLIASFSMSTNPLLILSYAAFQGVFLGAVSSVFALRILGVAPKLVKCVVAAAIAALGLIVVNLIAGCFVDGGLGLRDGGPLAIVFSVAMILLGCFFLLLDFDSLEQGVKQGAP